MLDMLELSKQFDLLVNLVIGCCKLVELIEAQVAEAVIAFRD